MSIKELILNENRQVRAIAPPSQPYLYVLASVGEL